MLGRQLPVHLDYIWNKRVNVVLASNLPGFAVLHLSRNSNSERKLFFSYLVAENVIVLNGYAADDICLTVKHPVAYAFLVSKINVYTVKSRRANPKALQQILSCVYFNLRLVNVPVDYLITRSRSNIKSRRLTGISQNYSDTAISTIKKLRLLSPSVIPEYISSLGFADLSCLPKFFELRFKSFEKRVNCEYSNERLYQRQKHQSDSGSPHAFLGVQISQIFSKLVGFFFIICWVGGMAFFAYTCRNFIDTNDPDGGKLWLFGVYVLVVTTMLAFLWGQDNNLKNSTCKKIVRASRIRRQRK